MKLFRVLAIAGTALLAGCITEGPFPSLAPRPDEQQAVDEPMRAAPQIADDSALRVRINQLLGQARSGDADFDRDYAAAARAASRAGREGSDSWIEAEQAYSRVEIARGRASDAAAELHQLAIARAGEATSADDREALEAATRQVEEIIAAQGARLSRLRH